MNLTDICEQAGDSFCPQAKESGRFVSRSQTLITEFEKIYKQSARGHSRYITFGATDGYSVTYPAQERKDRCGCGSFDPRFT